MIDSRIGVLKPPIFTGYVEAPPLPLQSHFSNLIASRLKDMLMWALTFCQDVNEECFEFIMKNSFIITYSDVYNHFNSNDN